MNIIFDASIIAEGILKKNYIRSGVYWAAYNILLQFCNNPNYNITILTSPRSYFAKRAILKQFKLKKIITYHDKIVCSNKVRNSRDIIKNTANIVDIVYHILRIIRNKYFILKSKSFSKRINNFDVYFSPMYYIPSEITNIKTISTYHVLHDCIPMLYKEHYPDFDENHWFSYMINNLSKETYYLCNSECTKNDYIKYFNERIDKNKIIVIYHAQSRTFLPIYKGYNLKKIVKKYKINYSCEYIYSLCTIQPRKNLLFSINCFIKFIKKHNIENLYYYLGGGYFPYYIKYFKEQISDYENYKDKIVLLGYVEDNDLNAFYSNSLFFVFLPMYEGFGIPVIEAMQSGTPVICSNNSSLPEVAGDAAIKITYNDEEACIKAFEDLYFNKDLRVEYISKGIERAKLFSWEKSFSIMDKIISDNYSNSEI